MQRSRGAPLAAVILLGVLSLSGPAFAAPPQHAAPQHVSGSFSGTDSVTSVAHRGFNLVARGSFSLTVSGALSGTCSGAGAVIVHFLLWGQVSGSCLFTGTAMVDGVLESGEAMVSFSGSGNAIGPSAHVRMVVIGIHGTGLAGLHGVGSASGSGGLHGPLSGSYQLRLD